MNSILIGLLLAVLGAGSSWYYRQDAIESKALYQSELARINAESAASKKSSEDSIHVLEKQHIKVVSEFEKRAQQQARKFPRQTIASCSTSPSGVVSAVSSDLTVELLREASDDPALREASDPSGFVGREETVTPDTIAAYCLYAVTEYNRCSIDFNALGLMVR